MSKKPEITFAESTVIESLEEQTTLILACFAKHFKCKGMAKAFISDQSCVSDFMSDSNEEVLKAISEELGVEVNSGDYIWEVALRLRKL